MGDVVLKTNLCRVLSTHGEIVCLVAEGEHRYIPDLELTTHETRNSFAADLFRSLLNRGDTVFVILTPGGGGNSMGGLFRFSARFACFGFLRLAGARLLQLGISAEKALPGHDVYFSLESRVKRFTGYRDSISIEKAEARGESNIGYFPDLSYPLWRETERFRLMKRERTLLISLRTPILEKDGSYEIALEKHTLALAKSTSPEDVSLFNQVDDDIPVQEALSAKTGWDYHKFDTFPYPLENLFELYGKHKFIVSNRLHALLFGSFCGCIPIPVISQSENGKIAGIFKDMGVSELCFDIESGALAGTDIAEHISDISSRSAYYSEKLDSWFRKNNDEIVEICSSLVNQA